MNTRQIVIVSHDIIEGEHSELGKSADLTIGRKTYNAEEKAQN